MTIAVANTSGGGRTNTRAWACFGSGPVLGLILFCVSPCFGSNPVFDQALFWPCFGYGSVLGLALFWIKPCSGPVLGMGLFWKMQFSDTIGILQKSPFKTGFLYFLCKELISDIVSHVRAI